MPLKNVILLGSSDRPTLSLGGMRFDFFHISQRLAVKQKTTDLLGTDVGFQENFVAKTIKKNICYKFGTMSLIRITNGSAVIAK